jgi:hypothetical protein
MSMQSSFSRTTGAPFLAALAAACNITDEPTSLYQEHAVHHLTITCPALRLGGFDAAFREFARSNGLHYRERSDNADGTLFVIVMENRRFQMWLVPTSSAPPSSPSDGAMLAQYMAHGIRAAGEDRSLFNRATETVRTRCGRDSRISSNV